MPCCAPPGCLRPQKKCCAHLRSAALPAPTRGRMWGSLTLRCRPRKGLCLSRGTAGVCRNGAPPLAGKAVPIPQRANRRNGPAKRRRVRHRGNGAGEKSNGLRSLAVGGRRRALRAHQGKRARYPAIASRKAPRLYCPHYGGNRLAWLRLPFYPRAQPCTAANFAAVLF